MKELSQLPVELVILTLENVSNTDLLNWATAAASEDMDNVAFRAEKRKRLNAAAKVAERRIRKLLEDPYKPYMGQRIEAQWTIKKIGMTPGSDKKRKDLLMGNLATQRTTNGPQLVSVLAELKTFNLTGEVPTLISALQKLVQFEP